LSLSGSVNWYLSPIVNPPEEIKKEINEGTNPAI